MSCWKNNQKLPQFCGVVHKSRKYFSKKQLLIFYNAFCQSKINYGFLLNESTYKTYLNEILNVQKQINVFERPSESLVEIMENHEFFTVFRYFSVWIV